VDKAVFYLKKLGFLILCTAFLAGYYFSSAGVGRAKALLYPRFIMILFGIILIWNIAGVFKDAAKELSEKKQTDKTTGFLESIRKNEKAIVIFLSAAAFVFLGRVVGFWVTTLVYILMLSYYLGVRKLRYLIPQSLIIIAVLYAVFGLWLKLSLPKGLLL